MQSQRKPLAWGSAAIAVFVLATAIYTGNSGLFILAGLSAAAALGLAASRPRA